MKWTYFYLYDVLDVLRRYVVERIVRCESATRPEQFIRETCACQGFAGD